MIGNSRLTTLNPEFDERARTTIPGMAHWAEPASNKKCGECNFWSDELNRKTARRCEKFSQLMGGARGARVPRDTKACRYFTEVD
jgi:hypothetical protein